MTQSPPLFRLQNVTKRFGSVVANKDVTFAAYPNRIHALLGENGAGKSTLMSILSGRYQPDAAEMVLHNLQIIPHSELGAITNYMRGGIIVKFNLEFPYDADIDKIRKVIKKVGKAMLADEELGKDFIKPVKSQGVREIANSVMVIRVKFTANPGAHFVIRREAYKRITEALNKKGIYYAHKKVIVDIPSGLEGSENSAQAGFIAKGAGAAADAAEGISQTPSPGGDHPGD
jgi:ABC-type cobalamin/Fe3+-siderophores transport system ATPase subunit